jgi:NAD dependent epimerase/dehydratase family enzyme
MALRVALGEMADVVLGSQRVLPAKAEATGYTFRFASLDAALGDLVGDRRAAPGAPEARP